MKDHYLSKFNLGADIPKWIPSNTHYLTITGSYSYGTNMSLSDCDIAGFCIPPRDYIFSQAAGYIDGFDNPPRFDEWQKHHVEYKDRNYDFKVFSIVKFFKLLSEGNPNSIDILYTDRDCIQLTTSIGEMVRKNRSLFLSKRIVPRFRGYAYAELKNVHNLKTGQRKELVEQFGFDTKNCSHVVRLLLECEQILATGDLNLRRDRELLKHIREGNWSLAEVQAYFDSKERYLLELEQKSLLPATPDMVKIKQLLLDCLESHYGSLSNIIEKKSSSDEVLRQVYSILENNKNSFLEKN